MKRSLFQLLILVIGLFILTSCSSNNATGAAVNPADFIGIPLNQITDAIQKYQFDADGVTVTYFAVKGSDGKVRTAFDACDVCGGSKGYQQQGTDIKCNNCGKVFKIDGLGTKNKGYGCWPSYLSHLIKDGQVMISKKEITQGKHRFV